MKLVKWTAHGLLSAALILISPTVQSQSQPESQPAKVVPTRQSPQVLFKNLFVAVQSAQLFPDSKTFADAVPKSSPGQILARFRCR